MAKVKVMVSRVEKWITFENVFKAVVLLMVWGLLSIPVAVYFASKEESTSSDWLGTVSKLLQSLEGNCDPGRESSFNETSNRSFAQNCSSSDSGLQVSCLRNVLMHPHGYSYELSMCGAALRQITLSPLLH